MLEFQEEWRKLDPASTYFISCHYLPTLIRALLPPLGFESGKDTPNALVNARIRRAWLPVREGRVQFQEVLFALSRLQAGQSLPDCELRQYLDKQARKHLELKELKGAPVDWTAHEFVAAELMQALPLTLSLTLTLTLTLTLILTLTPTLTLTLTPS